MTPYIWVNTGLYNGLLPNNTKPLLKLDFLFLRFCGIHPRAISQWVINLKLCKMSLENMLLILLPHTSILETNVLIAALEQTLVKF